MTPYDAALRVAERRLDAVRSAIGVVVGELERIEQSRLAIEAALLRESALAASDHRLTTALFFVRAREQHLGLVAARTAAHVQLEALRRKAVNHYGSQIALAGAASQFHAAAERARDSADQAALDDRTGARHAVRMRRYRAGARS